MNLTTQPVAYRDGEARLLGEFVTSGAGARRPGVLVVHGGAGLDDHARGRAAQLAATGWVVLACDMYGQGVAGSRERILAAIAELRRDRTKLCRRAQAGLAALAAHPEVDGRLAAVGYCFGGMTVLELARSGAELKGVASVHGSLATDAPARPGAVRARVLVCHGALDPHVPPPQVGAFVEEMNAAGADWQLNVYGQALHGFTHRSGPAGPGVAYHAAADARSSADLRAFLLELFGGAG